FRLSEGFRQCGTVHLNKRFTSTWTLLMNPTGKAGFSSSGFSLDQDGRQPTPQAPICLQNTLQIRPHGLKPLPKKEMLLIARRPVALMLSDEFNLALLTQSGDDQR